MKSLRADLLSALSEGSAALPSQVIPWPGDRTGVFVSLIRERKVVGCIGSFEPSQMELYATVLQTACRATREDVRHPPLHVSEIERVEIVVTFVGPPSPLSDIEFLHPWEEGLLAVQGPNSAVVVPGEAKTTRYAIELAMTESGLNPGEPIEYYRFPAITWRESECTHQSSAKGIREECPAIHVRSVR
jgi:AMMECR1 domain-containing protein